MRTTRSDTSRFSTESACGIPSRAGNCCRGLNHISAVETSHRWRRWFSIPHNQKSVWLATRRPSGMRALGAGGRIGPRKSASHPAFGPRRHLAVLRPYRRSAAPPVLGASSATRKLAPNGDLRSDSSSALAQVAPLPDFSSATGCGPLVRPRYHCDQTSGLERCPRTAALRSRSHFCQSSRPAPVVQETSMIPKFGWIWRAFWRAASAENGT